MANKQPHIQILFEFLTVSFPFQGKLDSAVSLALPLHLFYKNAHVSSENVWAYIEDELFIPMRPHLKHDIGNCVCIFHQRN